MQLTIKRDYAHKTYGAIGSVHLAFEGKLVLGTTELNEAATTALLTHALQYLQDAYAGAKTADEATSAFDKKLGKLLDGTAGVRGPRKAPLTMQDDITLDVVKRFAGKLWAVPKGTKPLDHALAMLASWPDKRKALVADEVQRQIDFFETDDDELEV